MCGRFSLFADPPTIRETFDLPEPPNLEPRYNIAPTDEVATVGTSSSEGPRSLATLRWGLLPHWVDDPNDFEASLINARAETVHQKPSFQKAFLKQRCIIPASGFYEWQETGEDGKQPYFVKPQDEDLFGFAGLWDHWTDGDRSINSCTIITTLANDDLEDVHDRMPVILTPDEYDTWLDPEQSHPGTLKPLLDPYPVEGTEVYPVSKRVNNIRNDDAKCVKPLES